MKTYNYNALDESGLEKNGFIQGADQNIVVQQLRQKGLYVVKLEEDQETKELEEFDKKDAWTDLAELLPVSTADKVFFFKQLALMLRSGISITEAIDIITRMQKGKIRHVCMSINRNIKSGESFSKAIEKHKEVFPNVAVQMIRSAETSGEIDIALLRIADYMEHKSELKKQVTSAMMYPAFTFSAAMLVFVFLLVYIIPKFQDFLANSGKQPPPATQLMIDIGVFFNNNWLFIIICIAIFVIGFIFTYKKPKGRYAFDQTVLSIPVIGGTISSASMAQLSWGMSMLLKSGIPVVDALRIISDMTGNKVISESINDASGDVLHGKDLAASFERTGITPLLHQLMIVGERSGNLVQIMDEASGYYEDDLRSKTKLMANMVEPLSIILIGGIVGFVYYGFFQAVLSLTAGA